MKIRSEDHKRVTLIPLNLTMEQKLSMTLFSITDFKLTDATDQSKGIQMKLKLKRKIMSEMMTTYFPSLLLMMITFATTFFKPFFFEAALSVNLTTMLVMTTIFISKMEGLPPTSETKMIDMWLILCQLVPFIEVILVTVIEFYKVDEKEMAGEEDTDMDMSMILADLYARKMDKDIPVVKENAENNEMVEVGSGNKFVQLWKALCEKHENEGVIVPHLHVIGRPVLGCPLLIRLQLQNRKLYLVLSSSWPSYTFL